MTITEPDVATLASPHPDIVEPHLDPGTIAEIDAIKTDYGTDGGTMPRPTQEACIEAIIREANCSYAIAKRVEEFWEAASDAIMWQRVDGIQEAGFDGCIYQAAYHLGDDDLRFIHPVLEIVAPDDHQSSYGSGTAHDLLDRRHCDPAQGVRGLVHSKSADEVRNCTVYVDLVTVS